jgi:putative hemolysin
LGQLASEIGLLALLIGLNGFFAMTEIAVVTARRGRLQQMVGQGNRGARAALEMAETPGRFLSTVQVGISLVGVLAGAIGGAALAEPLSEALGNVPLLADYADTFSVVIVVLAITYLSVVLGELVPKRIGLQNAERIAAAAARPMNALSTLARPVVRLLSVSTEAILRLLGVPAKGEEAVTEEEIRILVDESARSGIIEAAERDMVESVFRLGDRTLEAMMTPRTEIIWLDVNDPAEKNKEVLATADFSRLPVCDGDLDRVLGVVQAKDVLQDCLAGRPLDLTAALQEPLFVPETMRALRALERFKESGVHLAFLVDEYGGIEGLVTLMDLLEAIVGDIPSEEEIAEPPIALREDGSWLVDGLLPIDEFKDYFDVARLPAEASYRTLGGFMVYHIGRIARPGDHFVWDRFRFEVMDMDGHRVDKVLIQAQPEEDAAAPE